MICGNNGDIAEQPLGQAVNQSSVGHWERGRELGVDRDPKNGFNPTLQVLKISSIIHVHWDVMSLGVIKILLCADGRLRKSFKFEINPAQFISNQVWMKHPFTFIALL